MTKFIVRESVTSKDKPYLVDFISQHCQISKSKIKRALIFGGGWLRKKSSSRWSRCRKAKQVLEFQDAVEFYCDTSILEGEWVCPQLLQSYDEWGIWYKPANLLSQGTKFGDLNSMEVQITKLTGLAKVNLIHCLDREACGVMVFAYSKNAARQLSLLWQQSKVDKYYQVEVLGKTDNSGVIEQPLDSRSAYTQYIKLKDLGSSSLLEVQIRTGRLHQIRRHMALIGHPVMGDPKYGRGNKSREGMRLVATRVKFNLNGKQVDCELPVSLHPFS